MNMFNENEPYLYSRDTYERQPPMPELRIRALTGELPSLEERSSSDSSDGSSSSQSSNITPIVIGVLVPVLIIAIILFVVWRRRSKITKEEESHDKYRSLDFGVDPNVTKETKRRKPDKRVPEMSLYSNNSSTRKDRGVSIDLGETNPYLLPPEVHESSESLHSLSRLTNGDDKYRATNFVPDDGSIRSPSSLRSGHDSSSIFTGSTKRFDTDSRSDFYPRAPSRNTPSRNTSQPPDSRRPTPPMEKPQGGFLSSAIQEHDRESVYSTASGNTVVPPSHNYSTPYVGGGRKMQENKQMPRKEEQPGLIVKSSEALVTPPVEGLRQPPAAAMRNAVPKRSSSHHDQSPIAELADNSSSISQGPTLPIVNAQTSHELDSSSRSKFPDRHQSRHAPEFYDPQTRNNRGPSGRVPSAHMKVTQTQHDNEDASEYHEDGLYADYENYIDYAYRGSMLGVRPLPPDDPAENPEQRANRIRSFYKEYFDDGSGGSRNALPNADYYDGSEQYQEHGGHHDLPPPVFPGGRHRAMSHGPPIDRGGPRSFSSASGKMGPGRKMPPKKKLPPPKPLMTLPTPHKLKQDNFLPDAYDFAPPQMFKNQRAGTPDSLRGEMRPYSPSVRAHVPLQSSFDDLAVMPSPHTLRKSRTFTNLDFAPPRRFKERSDTMSETGSVHSNGSNLSRVHLANIRNGAYRVSRIPKEVAGTRDDMYAALKPKWDLGERI